jgi:hypothetical protein
MKAYLKAWNKQSRLWQLTETEFFWAGEYQLCDCSDARESYLQHHTHRIDTILGKLSPGSRQFLTVLKQRFLTFEEYELLLENRVFSKHASYQSSFAPHYWELIQQSNLKLLLPSSNDHETNYLALLKKWLPRTATFFFRHEPVPVPMSALHRHLIITGRTGSGKSQFLQTLFYQLQFQTHHTQQASMVFLDPHGDISEKLLSLRLNGLKPERLWYIDPQWDTRKVPCLNPFWNKVKDPILVDLLSQQWAKAFSELIPEAGLSLQMEVLLRPCLAVMFQRGECGLFDLQIFMDDAQNEQWVALGRKSKNPVFRNFFEQSFMNKKYAPTKLAIFTRLQMLLNNYSFYQMFNGRSTIDLKRGMQEGKIILFNLSKGKLGEDTSKALARFVSATLLSIALQRANEKEGSRKRCYLFADEFHNMASSSMETVFSEARKFNLHLLVGTQTIGQLPTSLKNMVLNNTAVKLVGINGLPALKSQAGDIGVTFSQLQKLPPYHFYLKYDHHPALKIKSADFMLKSPKRYFGNTQEVAKLKTYLLDKSGIYRSHETDPEPTSGKQPTTQEELSLSKFNPDDFTPQFEL